MYYYYTSKDVLRNRIHFVCSDQAHVAVDKLAKSRGCCANHVTGGTTAHATTSRTSLILRTKLTRVKTFRFYKYSMRIKIFFADFHVDTTVTKNNKELSFEEAV